MDGVDEDWLISVFDDNIYLYHINMNYGLNK